MSAKEGKSSPGIALLVDPEDRAHDDIGADIPGWCVVDFPAERVEEDAPEADAVLVYAHTHAEGSALEVSKKIRDNPAFDDVPVLVAITIYQMPLAHDVQKLDRGGFIFRPVQAKDLDDRIEKLTSS